VRLTEKEKFIDNQLKIINELIRKGASVKSNLTVNQLPANQQKIDAQSLNENINDIQSPLTQPINQYYLGGRLTLTLNKTIDPVDKKTGRIPFDKKKSNRLLIFTTIITIFFIIIFNIFDFKTKNKDSFEIYQPTTIKPVFTKNEFTIGESNADISAEPIEIILTNKTPVLINDKEITTNQTITQNKSIKITTNSNNSVFMKTDNSVIFVEQNTEIEVEKNEATDLSRKLIINLKKGKLYNFVDKLPTKKIDFKVKTPTVVAGVRGTKFLVITDAVGNTEISCSSGKIEILDINNKFVNELNAGFSITANLNAQITAPAKISEKTMQLLNNFDKMLIALKSNMPLINEQQILEKLQTQPAIQFQKNDINRKNINEFEKNNDMPLNNKSTDSIDNSNSETSAINNTRQKQMKDIFDKLKKSNDLIKSENNIYKTDDIIKPDMPKTGSNQNVYEFAKEKYKQQYGATGGEQKLEQDIKTYKQQGATGFKSADRKDAEFKQDVYKQATDKFGKSAVSDEIKKNR